NQLFAAQLEERQALLESYLCSQVGKILGFSSSSIRVDQSLITLGTDSLMAMELKNRIETNLGVSIPMVNFLQGPSIAQVATYVLDQRVVPASMPVALSVALAHASATEIAASDDWEEGEI